MPLAGLPHSALQLGGEIVALCILLIDAREDLLDQKDLRLYPCEPPVELRQLPSHLHVCADERGVCAPPSAGAGVGVGAWVGVRGGGCVETVEGGRPQ